MKRQLKFRAWNTRIKGFVLTDHVASFTDIEEGKLNIMDGTELMQYTEQKDKNGVEIYDGDLIRNSVGEVYLVYYDRGTPFIHDISKDGDFEDVAMFMCSSFGEIIGNKYENKEIMENK